MDPERLLSALDALAPPGAALASAMSSEALRRNWDRTSRHIIKDAQDKVALEQPDQSAPAALHSPGRVEPTPG